MMSLSRDPANGEITYEVSTASGGPYKVRRLYDNGSNASQYDLKGEQEFCDLVAVTCAAAEGGTVI